MPSEFDKDSWCTPKWFADLLPEVGLDPCSNSRSHVRAKVKFTKEDCGLDKVWRRYAHTAFVNPPYSNMMPWARAISEFARAGGVALCLVKLDPSTKWWAELMTCAADCSLLRKRMQFEGDYKPGRNNFCSALIVCADTQGFPSPSRGNLTVMTELIDRLRRTGVIW